MWSCHSCCSKNHSIHIHYVHLSHSLHIVYVFLSTSLNIYPQATFSDFHSAHQCNWCNKNHPKSYHIIAMQCNRKHTEDSPHRGSSCHLTDSLLGKLKLLLHNALQCGATDLTLLNNLSRAHRLLYSVNQASAKYGGKIQEQSTHVSLYVCIQHQPCVSYLYWKFIKPSFL